MENKIQIAKNNGNKLYDIFLEPTSLSVLEGRELKWRGSKKASLELLSLKPKDPSDLIQVFGLNADMFKGKFVQAIYGGGYEWQEIRTLHSSSLLSLLCFYNVSALNPLESIIDSKPIRFTESLFEIQNPIPQSDRPSNVDVVLIGRNMVSGRKTTLYLESKFSEYLTHGEKDKISTPVYREIYHKLKDTLDIIHVTFDEYSEKYSRLIYQNKHCSHYLEGIKQIVSHYLGVQTVATEERAKDEDIYLGEILYMFPESIDRNSQKYRDYTSTYEVLAKGLNRHSKPFKVLDSCLSYQSFFHNYQLDDSVRKFYSL